MCLGSLKSTDESAKGTMAIRRTEFLIAFTMTAVCTLGQASLTLVEEIGLLT